ncbi:sensor histidine kinase [Glycomyces buryatensis]|uniref:histidine kinase n=1 Tax=Glycomyces buryatensis TaxID=2570927 RepID=A0A4S8Q717_9ACTN|nr:histidine kinase [Glycomyces buryatensis]THV40103.1 two-component sensor histidine kinase [Glycomyces buryatensis]
MTSRQPWSARLNRIGARTLKIGIVSMIGLTLFLEAVSHPEGQKPPIYHPLGWFETAVGLFVIGVFWFYRPGRKRWIAYAAIVSIATTLIVAFDDRLDSGIGELFGMWILLLFAVRHWDAPPGRWVAIAQIAAIMFYGFRWFSTNNATLFAAELGIFLGTTSVVGFGAYLYSMDKLRRETQDEVRRSERLELAREMHDFVAHHVTGIVVLAQAAQVADTNPQKSFADIEEAGLAALTSMRRMVTMLREPDSGAGTNPLGDLAQIEDLVQRFSSEGTDATSFISPELAGRVAPEIAATAHRVVREALTNTRKHARGAGHVRVVVAAAGTAGLEVSVRDDGRPGRGRLAESGGGLGLLGLTERVETVGGQFRAGPRDMGGWETVAWLPNEPIPVAR